MAKVREDKVREAGDGFDGTWVAHPDLVQVAKEPFDQVLGERPNQVQRRRDEVTAVAKDLLDIRVPGGTVTEGGLRNNISVAIQYIESWLRGVGAAAIYNLMEDAATAEIARTQVWQWIRHGVRLSEGPTVTRHLVRQIAHDELGGYPDEARPRFERARALFELVALGDDCLDFLTLPAYEQLE